MIRSLTFRAIRTFRKILTIISIWTTSRHDQQMCVREAISPTLIPFTAPVAWAYYPTDIKMSSTAVTDVDATPTHYRTILSTLCRYLLYFAVQSMLGWSHVVSSQSWSVFHCLPWYALFYIATQSPTTTLTLNFVVNHHSLENETENMSLVVCKLINYREDTRYSSWNEKYVKCKHYI